MPRPTVRVLLVDDRHRLLLWRGHTEDGRVFWFPTGGGVEPGETAEAAAVREVAEETGRSGLRLGPEVWHRRVTVGWGGVDYDLQERWFLTRVEAFAVDTSGFTPEERAAGFEPRWWGLDELRTTRDRLVPRDLAARLELLLREGPPPLPVEIGR